MKHVKGDLIHLARQGEFNIIVHGCNCFHTMGGGIALQLAQTFPGPDGPAAIDRECTVYGDREKLGAFTLASGWSYDSEHIVVINGYTQFGFEPQSDGSPPVDYDAVRNVFKALAQLCENLEDVRIGYPAIGAGLAGGDWDKISAIIDEELEGLDHTYVEYETPQMRRQRVAKTLRSATTEDLFYDPWMGYTGAIDDEALEAAEDRIGEVIEAMEEAAQLLESST